MKVMTSIKPICSGCILIKRKSKSGVLRLYRYCKTNPKHKARQH
ncbi:50S ribosomal protein L36 [candidate division SR1 bacterium Aalborg_AAW-1]|nr:50S ribosomal protein L36 [candidate division SR1 bacterium Aalborg_AAW-1]